jgi:hypothetical protein
MTSSSLASDETTSSSSLPAVRTREEGNTFIPSKMKSSSSPLEGEHARRCRLVSSFMKRFCPQQEWRRKGAVLQERERGSKLTIKCTGDNDDNWINR